LTGNFLAMPISPGRVDGLPGDDQRAGEANEGGGGRAVGELDSDVAYLKKLAGAIQNDGG
jgi:hypothetical protein